MKNKTYWFCQKRFGLGAAPNTWQGWILTELFVLFLCTMCYWVSNTAPNISWWRILGLGTALFIFLVWKKTDGGWRWRWGNDPSSDSLC